MHPQEKVYKIHQRNELKKRVDEWLEERNQYPDVDIMEDMDHKRDQIVKETLAIMATGRVFVTSSARELLRMYK